jgi:hypothetical protein
MRSRTSALLLSLGLLAAGVAGCGIVTPGPPPPPPPYVAPSSPENVIFNLGRTYVRLDPVEYDSLLTDDYVFRFLQGDAPVGRADSLIRAEEMAFAGNLFVNGAGPNNPVATQIRLALATVRSQPDPRIGHNGWVWHVVNTELIVYFADGTSFAVISPAWLYFRQVPAGSGRWRLAEWADQPGAPDRQFGPSGAAASRSSWGVLRRAYATR